ncbi:indole-3-glycerol phosphate synthase [Candidatus Kinetoplastibacterium blastocrithidii TCC012E]|uniref:Indole-3-glycerol phosphate synthase n=1 Tax=Candidatus Kinetoplastidibacterium blastocrithidiae TCC012E TaxID=1208922 RepID=M1LZJ8_9PROT|nr:indole-3-glycerol phosphate synthase TrpC [Candidatus Kinetoplastibacterium blastocrithidii]AFZ83393.1 indole-3-glycerol-phosphate synthase [Candidatus Kinetoplastibacterium blastocrithidii (ex Strigomonas culicis)]AGF49491.1 indole-3-glycerol phosphate synthase [Candidatus Kinetoplastibacterium blastocrithidii TCC012E]
MNDILKKIVLAKKEEIIIAKQKNSNSALVEKICEQDPTRGFADAIEKKVQQGLPSVIAEIKKASPSKGILRKDFDPEKFAITYAKNGATCLSVLTDREFFHGCCEDLLRARSSCNLPILRKDFVIDPYQVLEARSIGADCILLIVSILDINQLIDLEAIAMELGMDVLVETHTRHEIDAALHLKTKLIGINNRNLGSFHTDINNTLNLKEYVPNEKIIITESGFSSKEDIEIMRKSNINAFLIGEVFMKSTDPGQKLSELIS